MSKYKWIIVILNLIAVLAFFNYSVIKKEKTLSSGQLVLLELAPVDPRSLMQGDYMQLDYAISQDVTIINLPKRGYCVVKLDADGVGRRLRLQPELTPHEEGEYLIRYNAQQYIGIRIGAESYFFQEGNATKYEKARYGGIRVDDKGHSVLVGLYDEACNLIE